MTGIKLRAWDKYDKSMSYNLREIFQSLADNDGTFVYLQFTGIIDKNEKEVYEGDIVKCWKEHMSLDYEKNHEWISGFGIAVIENNKWGFSFKEISQEDKNGWFFVDPESVSFHPNGKDQTIEVIGNIYENQKLLENHNIK